MTQPADGAHAPATACLALPLRPPGLRRRMACWLYEGVLLFGVVMVVGLVFSILTQSRHALQNRHAMMAVQFVALALYFVRFWTGQGQTLAMKTWHIRVVDRLGRPLGRGRALWRYLLCWVWFLPPLALMQHWPLSLAEVGLLLTGWVCVWALLSRFHPSQQFWHDLWAGTRLADVRPGAA